MSWALEAIEAEADARAYRQLGEEAVLKMEVSYRDDLPLRWFLFAYDFGEEAIDYIAMWQEDDMLAGVAATMAMHAKDGISGVSWRDRTAARLRVFADRVAALPLPAP